MKNTPLISSIIFFLIGAAIIAGEVIKELQGGWVRSEMVITALQNMVFVTVLVGFLYRYLKNKNKLLKYVMSIAFVLSLTHLFVISLTRGSDIPNLAVMSIAIMIYIIPGLLFLRGMVAGIRCEIRQPGFLGSRTEADVPVRTCHEPGCRACGSSQESGWVDSDGDDPRYRSGSAPSRSLPA
jgi:hypothetical protein